MNIKSFGRTWGSRLVGLAVAWMIASANPLWANPIAEPLGDIREQIFIDVTHDGERLHVHFSAQYDFLTPIASDVDEILFPILDEATSITLERLDRSAYSTTVPHRTDIWEPLLWSWSSQTYPTVLPEAPQIPMMDWAGPFEQAVFEEATTTRTMGQQFRVFYEHDLIEREGQNLFFYPLGVWKYYDPPQEEQRLVDVYIYLPDGYVVSQMFLDNDRYRCGYSSYKEAHCSFDSEAIALNRDLILDIQPFDGFRVLGCYPNPGQTISNHIARYQLELGTEVGWGTYFGVSFSDEPNSASISQSNCSLVRSGGDGLFDNGNDVTVPFMSMSMSSKDLLMQVSKRRLPTDDYRLTLGTQAQPIVSKSGVSLDGENFDVYPSGDGTPGGVYVSTFHVDHQNASQHWELMQ